MAFISPLVIDRLNKMFPEDKIDLIDGGRAILVNGTVFHSDWAGEELEKFGVIGAGLQDAIIADFARDMAPLLKANYVAPVEEPKEFKLPEKEPEAPVVAPEAPKDETPVEGSVEDALKDDESDEKDE